MFKIVQMQIAKQVMDGKRLLVPCREKLPGVDMQTATGLEGYVELMQKCWAQNPDDRPSFQEVIQKLR